MKNEEVHRLRWVVLQKLHKLRVDSNVDETIVYELEDRENAKKIKDIIISFENMTILRTYSYSPNLIERFVTNKVPEEPRTINLRIKIHPFYKVFNDYRTAFESGNITCLDKYCALISNSIYVSYSEGVFKYGDDYRKSKVYKIGGSRRKLLYALESQFLTAAKLIPITNLKDKYSVNKAVSEINKLCSQKIGLLQPIIVLDPEGYILNRSTYRIEFVA